VEHLGGLLRWAAGRGLRDVCLHVITDGRDTDPNSAALFLTRIEQQIEEAGIGTITTMCGRYWAMDRDNRWERTEKAYRLLTEASPLGELSPREALEASYAAGVTDEFLEPVRFAPELLQAGDGLVCFNFRPDRARQLIRALVLDEFSAFERQKLSPVHVVTFTQYEQGLPVRIAFPPESLCRNREISPRYLFHEWGDRTGFPWRRSPPRSLTPGAHLRPGSGDVGPEAHR
jgi:2,3-bisphosphoglycerate-independent phosphoglycerate mutase